MAVVGITPTSGIVFVKAIATSNLTLSGTQTVDAVALTAGMLCGVLGQSGNIGNGVYIVQAGAWKPCDPGIGTGLQVYATGGSANVNALYSADTTGAISWGTTAVAFTKKSGTGGIFDPASPGNLGTTNPAIVKATHDQITGTTASPGAGYLDETGYKLQGSSTINAIQLAGETGARTIIGNGSASTTSATFIDLMTVHVVNNGTFDYPIGSADGGFVIIAAPANGGASIGGTVYFGLDCSTSLGGLAPTNITTTLGTANKLNVAASGSNIRFENKTGAAIDLLLHVIMMLNG